MLNIDTKDAQNRFAELLERAAAGEAIVITKDGREIARLVPIASRTASEPAKRDLGAAIQRWRDRRGELSLGVPLKQAINEGRPGWNG
jgi:prevent-host-death family protein